MSRQLKDFLQRWIITTVAVLVATHVVQGIGYDKGNWQALLVSTLVLGCMNMFIKPVLMLVSLPLLVVTLGLFTLVINALLLYFVGNLIHGFHVETFGAAFVGGVVISLVSLALNTITGSGNARFEVRRGKPRSSGNKSDGGGPIIDV